MSRRTVVFSFLVSLLCIHAFASGSHEPILTNWDYSITNQFALYSLKVAVRNNDGIELSEDDSSIVAMSRDAVLYVRERKATQNVELLAKEDGRAVATFLWINGMKRNIGSGEKRIIAELLVKAAVDFGIGGVVKMNRLYESDGIEKALSIFSTVQSSSAQTYLLIAFAKNHSLDLEESKILITATRDISGSSSLREVLEFLARKLPPGDVLTSELMAAAVHISSSSDTRDALIAIASERGLKTDSSIRMAETIKTIASSDDKRSALVYLSDHMTRDTESVDAYISAAHSISSSSDKRDALTALFEKSIPQESFEGLFRAIESISASDDKTQTLRELTKKVDLNAEGVGFYVDAAVTISSSSDKRDALTALFGKPIPRGSLERLFHAIESISASDDKTQTLKELTEKVDLDAPGVGFYLDAAVTISSSSDRRDALASLLDHQDVSIPNLKLYAQTAATISSSDDKKDSILRLLSYIEKKGKRYRQDDDLMKSIIAAVETISSSGDREECLAAVDKTFE